MTVNPHFFYALKLPAELKVKLANDTLKYVRELPFSRWVHEQDYHITLAFLGSTELGILRDSQQRVREALQTTRTFQLKIDHMGTFGNPLQPRILWAGVQPEPQLHSLRQKVFDACLLSGYKLEKRPFHPHITVARKWMAKESCTQAQLDQKHELKSDSVSFEATEVVLYQTHLDREPKYEEIDCFSLLNRERY